MGPDLGTDPVLEGGDDLPPCGVILGVGREDHEDVQRQPDRIALDLYVPFLQDVEESDLDLPGQTSAQNFPLLTLLPGLGAAVKQQPHADENQSGNR